MKLNDERIRNYNILDIKDALPSELIKTSREYYALAVLKYSFPDRFGKLHKAESPDLQDQDGVLGVEVTWGGSPRYEKISGESYKYEHAKTEKDKEKSLRKIQENGGGRDEISTTYPGITADTDLKNVKTIFLKKTKKASEHYKHIQEIGLAIVMDIPMFFFTGVDWGSKLAELNNESFDFVVIIHWSGIDIYDFRTRNYTQFRISRDDMDALNKIGRMATEGLIKDDDDVWL